MMEDIRGLVLRMVGGLMREHQKDTLEQLLLQIRPDNLHGEVFEDDGPQGYEIW